MFLHAGASAANFWHYYPAHSMSKLTTDKKNWQETNCQWLKNCQEKN
jgi:hypothetical protein